MSGPNFDRFKPPTMAEEKWREENMRLAELCADHADELIEALAEAQAALLLAMRTDDPNIVRIQTAYATIRAALAKVTP